MTNIEGVKIKQLKVIPDDRGRLMEILRRDDDIFQEFGQVYMTTAFPGVVKAWHLHKFQTDNFTCVQGRMLLRLWDTRKDSKTFSKQLRLIISAEENPILVQIPPYVWHGFKCISKKEALVINTVTRPYDAKNPDEYRFDWRELILDTGWYNYHV